MKIVLGVFISLACPFVQTLPTDGQNNAQTELTSEVPTDKDVHNEKGAMDKCDDIMANNGLNFSSFWHGAAHGIHSISLEEIKHFFEPEAPEQNRIPVVNTNLSAEQTIFFNSPLRGYDEDFKTMALQVMAFFMLNDKPYFYQQGVNVLEKISHQYHMHEIYAAAAPIYKKMKETPPQDQDLCPCVNDVTANGILTEMVNIAKKLKYFARQPRNRQQDSYSSSCSSNSYNSYSGGCGRKKRSADNSTEIITQLEQEYLAKSSHENARKLLDVNPWKTNTLTGPDQWISYEAMLTWSMLEEDELNDFAVFMYCKLNQPELDHAKDLFE